SAAPPCTAHRRFPTDGSSDKFWKVFCAEISLAASALRRSLPDLLSRADGGRSWPGNPRARKDQGLSAVVLGGPTGVAGRRHVSARCQRTFRISVPAAVGHSAGHSRLFREDRLLSLPVPAQCRGLVDDRAAFQRYDGKWPDSNSLACRAALDRDDFLHLRHVRSRPAKPGPARADDAWVPVVATRPAMDI